MRVTEIIEAVEKLEKIEKALQDLATVSEQIFLTETQLVDIDNRIDKLLQQKIELLEQYPNLDQLAN